jgi:hypothetical protein
MKTTANGIRSSQWLAQNSGMLAVIFLKVKSMLDLLIDFYVQPNEGGYHQHEQDKR